jgi:hypothetical protein
MAWIRREKTKQHANNLQNKHMSTKPVKKAVAPKADAPADAPVAAKVAKTKAPTKKEKDDTKLTAAIAAKAAPSKSSEPKPARNPALKIPYNWRIRSLARFITNAIEEGPDRTAARKELREMRQLPDVKDFVARTCGADQWDDILTGWFGATDKED